MPSTSWGNDRNHASAAKILAGVFVLACLARSQAPVPQVQINAPFVPSAEEVVRAMLKMSQVKTSDIVYDLGCGDGGIVIAAAKEYGAHGVGIDINPDLIRASRTNAQKASVEALVRFEINDVFEADIHNASVVFLYLLPEINLRLRPKLLRDLKRGTRIVSHDFDMGSWKPEKEERVGSSRIYLWTVPGSAP
jgi:SAM-dependent methyltransferase